MPKLRLLSCLEEKQEAIQPKATAAKKLLPGDASSTTSHDILPETVIDFSFLKPSFEQVKHPLFGKPVPFVMKRFMERFETGLSRVSLQWKDIFTHPLSSKLLDVSLIPPPIYSDLFEWIDLLMYNSYDLSRFVLWTYGYIVDSVFNCPRLTAGDELYPYSNVTILVAFIMILRSRPNVLYILRGALYKKQFEYLNKDLVPTPLTVWMIVQVSQVNLHAGVFSWVTYLLPLLDRNSHDPSSTDLILQLADKIMENPEAKAALFEKPDWHYKQLVPAPSFEIMLRLRFSTASTRKEEDTARFARIYVLLKQVALASARKKVAVIQDIFTVSLRSAGKGNNPVLAEEAAGIAIWSLGSMTENIDCWRQYERLCKKTEEACLALLKKLVQKWNALSNAVKQQFIPHIFTVSLKLAGGELSLLAKEAAAIAIWSLTENVVCWEHWDNLYMGNIQASVALLKELVEKLNDHSLKLLSSPRDTFALSQTVKSFRLKNKEANGYLYEEADKSCKVISRRLACGSSSLKGTYITAVVVVIAAAVLHLFYLRVGLVFITRGNS